MSVSSASATIQHLVIFIRHVLLFPIEFGHTNMLKHQFTHRPHRYGCYRCDDKFKTYGGMVCISRLNIRPNVSR